jgi:hypothetical protein
MVEVKHFNLLYKWIGNFKQFIAVQPRNPSVQTAPIAQHQLAAYNNPPQGIITNLAPGTRTFMNSTPPPATPNQNPSLQCPVHGQQCRPFSLVEFWQNFILQITDDHLKKMF